MPNPASVADLEVRWRPLTPQEQINADAFLSDAWALLTARRPTLDADMTVGTVSAGNVIRVLTMMVKRVMLNPELKRSETIDDYSYTRADLISTGALTVTDEELADVTPRGSAAGSRVRSVRLVSDGDV